MVMNCSKNFTLNQLSLSLIAYCWIFSPISFNQSSALSCI
ncbi:9822_t:CDS:2 [Racocetra persica]|uniref:9822_t:CDS:1 n=1 Tax=Racocetra persica TaxID=160502 RepID=A0ACA9KEF8_9GLOM|nr:9822_t:CDS:2 [Racocetra persica]